MRSYRVTVNGWTVHLQAVSVQEAITDAIDTYLLDLRHPEGLGSDTEIHVSRMDA
jgi:hypothetical protein